MGDASSVLEIISLTGEKIKKRVVKEPPEQETKCKTRGFINEIVSGRILVLMFEINESDYMLNASSHHVL